MKPKKSLGQNFLTNKKAIFDIVNAGEIKKGEYVLEIGPGRGALTFELLKSEGNIVAIEKDKELITHLQEKFSKEIEEKRLKIIEGDILEMDPKILFKNKDYKIVANIPYYITGAILEKFLEEKKRPKTMVLLMQKEVADRIVARNKKESILSLAVKFYGIPKIICKVSAGSFFPKPKVDSAVLKIELEDLSKEKEVLKETYLNIIKKSFAYKRKIMLSNLKKEIKNVDWDFIFNKLNIDNKSRAEDLNENIFLDISREISK